MPMLSAPPLDAAGFERMLLDPDTPDEAIRPYLIEDTGETGPFQPVVRANPALVAAPETEAAVAMTALNGIARWRRQRRYRRKLQGWTGLRLVSEGDSWFQYPFLLSDVIDWLSTPYAILSLDAAGDLLSDMVRQGELVTAVVAERPDAVLLSGGGNDLLGGANLTKALSRFQPGKAPADYLGDAFEANLQAVLDNYERLFDRLRQVSPGTPVVTHVYDYALPARGRWLGRPMAGLGIADPVLQRQIVHAIVDRFEAALSRLAATFPNVQVIDTRNVVGAGSWHDELHPTDAGYQAVAERFAAAIAAATGTPVPVIDRAVEAVLAGADGTTLLNRHGEAALLREIGRREALREALGDASSGMLAEAGALPVDEPPVVFPSSLDGMYPELQERGEGVVVAAANRAAARCGPEGAERAARDGGATLVRYVIEQAGLGTHGQAELVAAVLAWRLAGPGGGEPEAGSAATNGTG